MSFYIVLVIDVDTIYVESETCFTLVSQPMQNIQILHQC